jgi:hypothetical protein
MRIRTTVLAAGTAAVAALGAAVPAALAHQTITSNGVAVTMHIAPDDSPVAGRPAQIVLVGARRHGWRFDRARCGCHLKITSSSGAVVFNRDVRRRVVAFTFPRAGAYQLAFSGHLRHGGHRRSFNAKFAYRAS